MRTSNLCKTSSRGDNTKWSFELYTTSKNVDNTLPSYSLISFSDRYNESLLHKTTSTKTQPYIITKNKFFNL